MSSERRPGGDDAATAVQRVFREHGAGVVARLVRRTGGDLDLAQDAVQQALEVALQQWPRAGVPDSPRAWLLQTARHKAIDEIRRRTLPGRKADELGRHGAMLRGLDGAGDPEQMLDEAAWSDDLLRLVFTCCHPALPLEGRVALTLRVIGGLETDEIARAFLVSSPTMGQRISRAKRKIREAGIPYRVPGPDDVGERLSGVLAVVYLVFNEGYFATRGDELLRSDLARVAIDLGRKVVALLPAAPEPKALLALLLLQHSRRDARTDDTGDLVLLEEQDRAKWDRGAIAEGLDLLHTALAAGASSTYALQAAVAALHAEASTPDVTDWAQIAALYRALRERDPSPVVALNHAVAVAFADGIDDGLSALSSLRPSLDGYAPFHAAEADLLRRRGDRAGARAAYDAALRLTENAAERRYLEGRRGALDDGAR